MFVTNEYRENLVYYVEPGKHLNLRNKFEL